MKEILLFGCRDKRDVQILKNIFVLQAVGIKLIEKKQYGLPISLLTEEGKADNGITPGMLEEYTGSELKVPVMVLAGFSVEELDSALALIRQKLTGSFYLKAILTEHNRNWNILLLSKHLQEEHRKMIGQ
ncbi:MAG: DUF3783 domain-containing protein [Lachnospiraceae bacterium]|nr:DUF3783 domain-containing protein [Lachnospiraceae bacterium]